MAAASRAALLVVLFACAGCGGTRHDVSACRASDLRISLGPTPSEATGQHTVDIDLQNRRGRACSIDGYPEIRLFDPHGRELSFRYSHDGDQMIPKQQPARLVVRPGGHARFAFNKYRCDLHATARASTLLVRLPGDGPGRLFRLPPAATVIDYCPETISLTIAVSPISLSLP